MFQRNLDLKSSFKNKRFLLGILGVVLLLLLVFLCDNDAQIYSQPIAKVTKVTTAYEKTASGPNNEQEKYYTQKLKAVVQNGDHKGDVVTLKNEYSESVIKSEKYTKGEQLFVELTDDGSTVTASITGVKRDTYFALLFGLTVLCLLLVTSKRGLLTIASLIVNAAVFITWIALNGKTIYDPKNWIVLVISFCTITLLLVSGFHRKTWSALISSFLCIGVIYGLYLLVAAYTKELPFELIEYITGPDSAEPVFIISVIVGSLGAIMDVAITISSSVSELVATTSGLQFHDLIGSMREIAMDIMGTMINVLFFSYISGALFKIVLEIDNGYSVSSLLHFSFVFEVVRFLIGSIGIVLTIPLSGLISVLFFWKKAGEVKCR
jgi:uncharacterized membrane protein